TYSAEMGWNSYNLLSTVGAFTIALGTLVFVFNFFKSVRYGELSGADPWDGATLEWSIPSPPPEHNFDHIPVVHSARPLWDLKYGAHDDHGQMVPGEGGALVAAGHHGAEAQAPAATAVAVAEHADEPHEHIHMPNPSYWP